MTRTEWLARWREIMSSTDGCVCGRCTPDYVKCDGTRGFRQLERAALGRPPLSDGTEFALKGQTAQSAYERWLGTATALRDEFIALGQPVPPALTRALIDPPRHSTEVTEER